MTRRRDDQLNPIWRAFQWLGGGVFVAALALCGYSYVVVWARSAPFDSGAIAIDVVLFTAFAAHHSVFARQPVKRWLVKRIPEGLLRSVYVWMASLLLILMCVGWQPVGGDVYHVQGWRALGHAIVQLAGVLMIASAVRAIDALELAGIRSHVADDSLQISGPYRCVRHPLYLGWLVATFGAAHMTGDRLFFSAISVFYLIIAVPFEERALVRSFGQHYVQYQQLVRWRIVPYVY
jgi:protein-S-isoprenylcysteine O-methyltransferase Ste14